MQALFGLTAAALLLSMSACAQDRMSLIDQIERKIVLPETGMALADFNRTYGFQLEASTDANPDRVYGYFVATRPGRGTASWSDEPVSQYIMDGGCSVIHVEYRISQQEVTRVWCNGVA
ncbi:hypothetical protein [Parasphingopyxis sp.]|uniref:hypothetical protein n=1 Tax=Parasphingopyxis sp. TaxID=1920299 RepID=UPI00260E6BA3|nr:hypothetical protein [Parasphingopyxis sp.]